ncbi:MAG TPA: hypothetical protein VF226_02095 [Hyphomicrobiaceae bacterium]|jgi:hypothetical protein
MINHTVLAGAFAAALLSLAAADAAVAGSKAQAINPECPNKYAVCPPKLKAKEKPDSVPMKAVPASKTVKPKKERSR